MLRNRDLCRVTAIVVFILLAFTSCGGEAPPAVEKAVAEAAESVEEMREPSPVTIEDVAAHIESHVAEMASAHGGAFVIRDDVAGTDLSLQLDLVHKERLAHTAEHTYFVCADFKTDEGKVYDLDFWVQNTPDGLEVTESMVHKEEGEPRYNWLEQDGVWVRQPV